MAARHQPGGDSELWRDIAAAVPQQEQVSARAAPSTIARHISKITALFQQTSLGPAVPATYRRLADFAPQRLAMMHGSSYEGDCAGLLRQMADVYEQRFGCTSVNVPAQQLPGHDGKLAQQN